MPHFIIEYSANLEPELDLCGLITAVHETAIATGVFPRGGARTRVARRDRYRIADGHPDNGFVHVVARIRAGRPVEVRKNAGEMIFGTICESLQSLFEARPLGISFEIQEIDPDFSFKKNNLHEYVAARARDDGGSSAP